MFELPHKDQIKMMQTVTNVLNLSSMHSCRYIRQHIPTRNRIATRLLDNEEKKEITDGYVNWFMGEYDAESKHQWFYNKFAVYLLNVAEGPQKALEMRTTRRQGFAN